MVPLRTLVLATLVLMPALSGALPQIAALDYVMRQSHPETLGTCDPDSLAQHPPGSPTIEKLTGAAPFRDIGAAVCEQVMAVSSIQLVDVEQGQDGRLTIRYFLPYWVTTQKFPLPKDQDPRTDSANFTDHAVRDVQDYVHALPGNGTWVPLIVNPNNLSETRVCVEGVACGDQGPVGLVCNPCTFTAGPVPAPELPDLPAASPGDLVGDYVLPETRTHLHRAGLPETVHRIEVSGYDEVGKQVFNQAFHVVALVDHTATDVLTQVQGTTFLVTSYLTPADEAVGRAIESVPIVNELPLPKDYLPLLLPKPVDGGAPEGPPKPEEVGCAYEKEGNRIRLDFRPSGCIGYSVRTIHTREACPYSEDQIQPRCHYWLNPGEHDEWARLACPNSPGWAETYPPLVFFSLSSCSGGDVLGEFGTSTWLLPKEDQKVRVWPVWYIEGGIQMLCDQPNRYVGGCAAHGAYLGLSFNAGSAPATGGTFTWERGERFYESASYHVEWCVPMPDQIPPFKYIAPFTSCWASLSNNANEQSYNKFILTKPYDIEMKLGRAYYLHSAVNAKVCCANPHNLPSIPWMLADFDGFLLERVA